uniref:Uncharacterized protein n=1 Tax=Knipowitschia caucasica TaxID=637954 RepID=A0AAV2LVS9_KNICA
MRHSLSYTYRDAEVEEKFGELSWGRLGKAATIRLTLGLLQPPRDSRRGTNYGGPSTSASLTVISSA